MLIIINCPLYSPACWLCAFIPPYTIIPAIMSNTISLTNGELGVGYNLSGRWWEEKSGGGLEYFLEGVS